MGAAGLLGLACAVSACTNDVSGQRVPDGIVVATYRAPGVELGTRRTFAIVARIGVVSDDGSVPSPVAAPALVAAVVSNLEARGFVKAAEIDPASPPESPPPAELAVNLTALESDRVQHAYWLGSSRHAAPGSWGFPAYAWTYAWEWAPIEPRRGTVVVEVADLTAAVPGGDPGSSPLAVGWAAFAYGASPQPTTYDDPAVLLEAIDRAFSQSPYLRAAP